MPRSARDHEVRSYYTATNYSRMVKWAGIQDRSVSNFNEHAVSRYMDWLEEQFETKNTRDSMPALRQVSDEIG